jgi:hypothetical protein
LNTDSRWLNSEEGLAQCKKQEVEERETAAQKQASRASREIAAAEERGQDEPFTGSLNSQQKAVLPDITYILGLDIKGMVKDLKLRINTFFKDKEHKELHTNPQYICLFPHLAWQTHQATIASTSGPLNLYEAI